MKKILWLVSWYPNKLSPFDGDFIQRHARAVALYQQVQVIFVVKDEKGIITDDVKVETSTTGDLSEVIAYYKPRVSGIKVLDRIYSVRKYLKINMQLVREFIKENGIPGFIHVHVAMWAGLVALRAKRNFKSKYIITEHWTGYHKEAERNIYKRGSLFMYLTKKILKNAALLVPVSLQLGKIITDNITALPYKSIPNVVNTTYFKYLQETRPLFRFIHVSTMGHQKNIPGILRAFSKLLLYDEQWQCVMIGPAAAELRSLSADCGLQLHIEWKGEIPYPDVAREMQRSSAMLMFSWYENLPCAILEAQCCGLPVIATRVGGIPEIINDMNGILVDPGNEQQLVEAMIKLMKGTSTYDQKKISEIATKNYSYEKVGNSISEIYNEINL